ncbi:MAG: serine/threonine protein kinase [Chloroflexi bacterium]|nr:serine/threonine protein kinase [Chloroflexota bacterium]
MRASVGECIDGRYVVGCLLAEGGSSEVYRAIDRHSGRDVVLKLPRMDFADDFVLLRRFRREIEIGSTLDHPNIQRVLSSPRDPNVVLEYVDGQSLRAYLRANGPLVVDNVIHIGLELAEALDYVHSRGLVHCDVKPDNILIGPDGRITLTDFGIACRTRRFPLQFPQPANVVGTPGYMAPEQVRGEVADARTDVYALGCVLYELLTGVVPYPVDAARDASHRREPTQPPLVRAHRPDAPAELEAVLYRAMRRRPQERYQSIAALANDLQHLETVQVPASYGPDVPPPAPLGDLPPWRTTLPVLGVIVVLLGAIGTFVQWAHHVTPH